MENTGKILASYITFKRLYNNGQYRSPYQILAEFIKHSIMFHKKYSFSIEEISSIIYEDYEFFVPKAVLTTTLKNTEDITTNDGVNFTAKFTSGRNFLEFEDLREDSCKMTNKVIEQLYNYVQQNNKNVYVNKDKLISNFINFVVEQSSCTYQEQICKFILLNEENDEIQQCLNNIKEGCILYLGISYGINEIGGITKDLTLFLNTEELFNIMGYNGEVYKELMNDFLRLVDSANINKEKIHIRYFTETKDEIIQYFEMAKRILLGKSPLLNHSAMKSIINGCSSVTDIDDKISDFFLKLRTQYHIIEDEKESYYTPDDFSQNLESQYVSGQNVTTNEDMLKSIKYVSHINKLRKGKEYNNYILCEYIFITESKMTLDMSKKIISESDNIKSQYAINLFKITNILWYKLNKGFGSNVYPKNISAVINARIVLSSMISQRISEDYEKIKKQYSENEITQEELSQRLLFLRNKPSTPDEIDNNIDTSLDFSLEAFNNYVAGIEKNKETIMQQEKIIFELQEENEFNNSKNQKEISTLTNEIDCLKREKETIIKELQGYKEKEHFQREKRKSRKNIFKFGLLITLVVLVSSGVAVGLYCLLLNVDSVVATWISIIVALALSVGSGLFIWLKRIYRKYFSKK